MKLFLFFLFYIGTTVIYYLDLAFLGLNKKFSEIIVPSLIVFILIYTSKFIFDFSNFVQSVYLAVLLCIAFVVLYKIDLLLSIMGAVLSMITVILGDLILVYPCSVILNLDIKFNSSNNFSNLVYMSLFELIIPIITIFVLRETKFNLQPMNTILLRK